MFFQLEEKTRRLRELESASNLWEGRIRQLEKEKLEIETKLAQTREALDEHVARLSKQVIITWFAKHGLPLRSVIGHRFLILYSRVKSIPYLGVVPLRVYFTQECLIEVCFLWTMGKLILPADLSHFFSFDLSLCFRSRRSFGAEFSGLPHHFNFLYTSNAFFFLVVLQLQHSEVSATRSSNLVQELYIENAKLTKALQQTEANEKRAEKANRQLTEQKRALQRVISKLCGANAIA